MNYLTTEHEFMATGVHFNDVIYFMLVILMKEKDSYMSENENVA